MNSSALRSASAEIARRLWPTQPALPPRPCPLDIRALSRPDLHALGRPYHARNRPPTGARFNENSLTIPKAADRHIRGRSFPRGAHDRSFSTTFEPAVRVGMSSLVDRRSPSTPSGCAPELPPSDDGAQQHVARPVHVRRARPHRGVQRALHRDVRHVAEVVRPGCTLRELIMHRKETGNFTGDVDAICPNIMDSVAKRQDRHLADPGKRRPHRHVVEPADAGRRLGRDA